MMRLYRALKKRDLDSESNNTCVLSSHSRAFEKEGENNKYILSKNINLPNEIYSHIMNPYGSSSAQAEGIIYSFTDDCDIAYSLLQKHPNDYKAIGYIDINENSHQIKENLYLAFPAYSLSAWVDLAAYYNTYEIQNVNNKYSTKLAHTFIPSHNGMLSWANNQRQYAIICKDLRLTLYTKESEKEHKKDNKEIFVVNNFVVNKEFNNNNKEDFKKDLKDYIKKLEIQESRKNWVSNEIDAPRTFQRINLKNL